VSLPAGIDVLANDRSTGINAHRKGADGIEGRCAGNVNRDGVRSIWELEKPMALARVVNMSPYEFLARIDVPNPFFAHFEDIYGNEFALVELSTKDKTR